MNLCVCSQSINQPPTRRYGEDDIPAGPNCGLIHAYWCINLLNQLINLCSRRHGGRPYHCIPNCGPSATELMTAPITRTFSRKPLNKYAQYRYVLNQLINHPRVGTGKTISLLALIVASFTHIDAITFLNQLINLCSRRHGGRPYHCIPNCGPSLTHSAHDCSNY
jgi:hypothetical protein